ncbi:MAG: HAD-IC family P-type ATPase, partial [Anaerolineaceae bacterium]|nr:HAD-IC family P-type ATPase [Anaerolineaceae bacterium]
MAIEGLDLQEQTINVTNDSFSYLVRGMDCADCALTLEKGIRRLEGIEQVRVHFSTERLKFSGTIEPGIVLERVRELGYEAVELDDEIEKLPGESAPLNFWQFILSRKGSRMILLGALLVLPGMIFEEILGFHHIMIDIASMFALLVAGLQVFRSAWKAVWVAHEININVLMSIASIGAAIIGAFTEAGMVMVLFALGEILESYTADRSRHAIRSLIQVVPNTAEVLRSINGKVKIENRGVEELQIGDRILVKPGERIPMDGTVAAGFSSVNQAPITGESRLSQKEVGSQVFASSINGEGSLEIEVTHLSKDNTISKLIKMVEEAQEKRAPTQRFVDRFARYYTPAVIAVAVLVALIPPLFFGQPFLNLDDGTYG